MLAYLVLAGLCEAGTGRHEWSGIYPHLAYYNSQGECGTGAVVPWAERLWVITYSPHEPGGSDDKLYEIDEELNITARPESVGGTPANRMIHRESQRLFIGSYVIDLGRNVRAISPKVMYGRLTGNARHLSDPAGKIYYATMEEGFYEVDVKSLEVRELYPDGNRIKDVGNELLPGYHGKGLYSGQGRLVYANNGERSSLARTNPDIASGCLAEWDGENWHVVRRNQFCEVSGPGGIYGNDNPETDPIWSIGWDHRSLILMLRDGGAWHSFRLPKASHCYDGAHGWNTEWPRIREVGEKDLAMTMHGMFWRFPKSFSLQDTSGIGPRSTYLMVIGDFCRWGERIVAGCDVTAKSEFLNKRKAKGKLVGPGQSQSNIRFIRPEQLDDFGPPLGRGAVWLKDAVKAGDASEPFLFAGFDRRGVHLAHDNEKTVKFIFEVDTKGTGDWSELRTVEVPKSGYKWVEFPLTDKGQWLRLRTDRDCKAATAYFQYSNNDRRGRRAEKIFSGLAEPGCRKGSGGLIRARGENLKTLHFAAVGTSDGKPADIGYYEIGEDMKLRRVDDPASHKWLKEKAAIPSGVYSVDSASVVYIDDAGRRYRLPKGDPAFDEPGPLGAERIDREVCTERDLFNCHGTFYELPAKNAGGFAKIRPIATHNRRITDYCSWRGLLVISGIAAEAPAENSHIIRSEDGRCALWAGAVDDLWKLGKPVGRGGPWKDTPVEAGKPSDPYLMTSYDRKSLTLSHKMKTAVTVRVEVDIDGNGNWKIYKSFDVPTGKSLEYQFSDLFAAYWVRVVSAEDAIATAQFLYE
ncbi:MAG: hypothetical protein ACYS8Z_18745 [Planctomycetota bacterium]